MCNPSGHAVHRGAGEEIASRPRCVSNDDATALNHFRRVVSDDGMHQRRGDGLFRKLIVATWNIRSLLDSTHPGRRSAFVSKELHRYNISIAALSEIRLAGAGERREQSHTFFWSGPEYQGQAGVGLAIENSLVRQLSELPQAHSDRLISLRIQLQGDNHVFIIAATLQPCPAQKKQRTSFTNPSLASFAPSLTRTKYFFLETLMLVLGVTMKCGIQPLGALDEVTATQTANSSWPFALNFNWLSLIPFSTYQTIITILGNIPDPSGGIY